ncbi:SH3 domain-containing protein [Muricoccus nepalensis]|uniref:SH3 domain-containing protein n=1 Tax=Muricoccus nepalensis TaxID=1854500 RepID=UPI001386894F|nr:SH3 domain-containing protein [Roseomonas nepalensis]
MAQSSADRRASAQRAAEDTIREILPGAATFRAVAPFRQAAPRAVAVCGRVRVAPGPFLPFVAVVTYWDDESEGGTVTPILATTDEGAARVAAETRTRCREGGGPPTGAAPPVPGRAEEASPDGAEAPAPRSAPGTARPGDTVTARLSGTLRSSPGGGGAAIGTVRAGSSVTVHGTAPGGWYQVGDPSGPSGWVHGSRLLGTP